MQLLQDSVFLPDVLSVDREVPGNLNPGLHHSGIAVHSVWHLLATPLVSPNLSHLTAAWLLVKNSQVQDNSSQVQPRDSSVSNQPSLPRHWGCNNPTGAGEGPGMGSIQSQKETTQMEGGLPKHTTPEEFALGVKCSPRGGDILRLAF